MRRRKKQTKAARITPSTAFQAVAYRGTVATAFVWFCVATWFSWWTLLFVPITLMAVFGCGLTLVAVAKHGRSPAEPRLQ